MVEIRAKVKLTNAMDESLQRRGQLATNQVRVCEADAKVDLASVWTVIPVGVSEKLGLTIRGERHRPQLGKNLPIAGPLIVEINGRDTIEEALVLGTEVRIGQTVVEKLDLVADRGGGKLIPNPAHPDQPVTMVK